MTKVRYIGPTKLVKQFKPVFEKDRISKEVAERNNMTQEEVLKDWEMKGQISIKRGNAVHKFIEDFLKDQNNYDIPSDYAGYCHQFMEFYHDFFNKDKPCGSEVKVFQHNSKTIGFIDQTCVMPDSSIRLYDWKTASKFTENNSFQTFLAPFDHLEDCSLVEFSLQLHMYKIMYEETFKDKEVSFMDIVQFNFNSWTCHEVMNLADEAKEMLAIRANEIKDL